MDPKNKNKEIEWYEQEQYGVDTKCLMSNIYELMSERRNGRIVSENWIYAWTVWNNGFQRQDKVAMMMHGPKTNIELNV